MTELAEKLQTEALQLNDDERAQLAFSLLQSLDEETRSAWEIELERRAEEMESGAVPGVPVEEVLKRTEPEVDLATADYPHISMTSDGIPVITGAGTKVVQVVLDHLAYGSDAAEIHREFPYLSLPAIHCALAYYYDHRKEMDEDIARRKRKVEELKAKHDKIQGPSPLRERLKAEGLLP